MRTKKLLYVFSGAIAFLLFLPSVSCGQTSGVDILAKRVECVKINSTSLYVILSEVAYRYTIPIGFETAKEDEVGNKKKITIDIPEGTIEEVLNAIIQAFPG